MPTHRGQPHGDGDPTDPDSDRRSSELALAPGVRVKLSELRFAPLRSGGPGGQNVNKVSNGVELRWSVTASAALSEEQRSLVLQRLSGRINAEGELVLRGVEFRERPRNVDAVLERLTALVGAALHRPPKRRPTRPTRGAQRRRRAAKERRSQTKRDRRPGSAE